MCIPQLTQGAKQARGREGHGYKVMKYGYKVMKYGYKVMKYADKTS